MRTGDGRVLVFACMTMLRISVVLASLYLKALNGRFGYTSAPKVHMDTYLCTLEYLNISQPPT